MSFPKFVNMTKNTLFFPILQVFAPLNNVRAYIAWSWKTTLITWIFFRGWYPTSNTSTPPPPPVLWSSLAWDVTQHMNMSAFGVISTLLLHTICALYPLLSILVPKPLNPYVVGLYDIPLYKTPKKSKQTNKQTKTKTKNRVNYKWFGPCRPMLNMLWAMSRVYYCDSTRHHNREDAYSRTAYFIRHTAYGIMPYVRHCGVCTAQ